MIRVMVVHNKKHGTINVYVHGLEQLYKILKKYGFEQGDDENGVLWWFGYPENVGDMMKFIDELRTAASVEYVEKQ